MFRDSHTTESLPRSVIAAVPVPVEKGSLTPGVGLVVVSTSRFTPRPITARRAPDGLLCPMAARRDARRAPDGLLCPMAARRPSLLSMYAKLLQSDATHLPSLGGVATVCASRVGSAGVVACGVLWHLVYIACIGRGRMSVVSGCVWLCRGAVECSRVSVQSRVSSVSRVSLPASSP